MKTRAELKKKIQALLRDYDATTVVSEVQNLSATTEDPSVCTILVNEGLHHFPESLFRGEKFVVYEGSFDFSSSDRLQEDVTRALIRLAKFLSKKKWSKIYLIISGHAAICMQVKLVVYRMTHLETVDWVFDGKGNYLELDIKLRDVIMSRRRLI